MNWFINLPRWARLSIAGSVCAGMFALIFWLQCQHDAKELVWAEGQEAIEWDTSQLPLSVYADPSWGEHLRSIEKAVESMNRNVGCTLMVMTDDLAEAHIHIQHEPCQHEGIDHVGCTLRTPDGNMAMIQVGQPGGDLTTSYLIFYHELTHAWGLVHDGYYPVPEDGKSGAIFVPITADNAQSHAYRLSVEKLLPELSRKDAQALRERYCD